MKPVGFFVVLFGIASCAVPARAASYQEVLEALAQTTRRTDKVPVSGRIFRHSDDLPTLKVPHLDETESLRRFDRLQGADEGLRSKFLALPARERGLVVELGEAMQKVLRQEDGIELLRRLDADGLAQVRTYGDFVGEGVRLTGPEYKGVVRKTGAGAGVFFERYLQPHYKQLLAAGLVAAYLLEPEKFHDAAGRLTEYAARQFTELGIEVAAAVPRGFWAGVRQRFADDPLFSGLGVALIFLCLTLLVPAVRFWLFGWWRRPEQPAPAATAPLKPEPFRE